MTPDLAFWGRLLAVLTLELALVVAALALVARWTRSPQLRRSLWQAGLVAFALIVTVECVGFRAFVAQRMPVTERPPERRLVASLRPVQDLEPVPAVPMTELPDPAPAALAPSPPPASSANWWPGYLWLLGTTLLSLRALALRGWLARERSRAEPGDTETHATIARLKGPLALRRVELRVWPRLRGPVAFGTLWPTIAVPADFAARFTPAQREAMLAHELAHLAGRDPFWLAVADTVCALAWWHPGVWWARHQLRTASEEAADEASALVPEGVTALAESLVAFGRELATPGPARSLGVAGSGFRSELGRRVAALLEAPPAWRPLGAGQRWRMRGAVVGGVAVLAALPWPGTGGPSVLAVLVHESRGGNAEAAAVPDAAAVADARDFDLKHYFGRNIPPLIPVVSQTNAISPPDPARSAAQRLSREGALSAAAESPAKALVLGAPASEAVMKANELAYDTQTGIVAARGGVVIQSGTSVLTAESVRIDPRNNTLVAGGDISLQTIRVAGAAASTNTLTEPPSGAVSGGLWTPPKVTWGRLVSPDVGAETGATTGAPLTARLVAALREAGVTVEPAVPTGAAANPPVAKEAASPAESPGIATAPELYTRTFRLADPVQFLTAIRQTPGVSQSTNIQADLRQFLVLCGLDFSSRPRSSYRRRTHLTQMQWRRRFYDPTGVMFVRATLADLDRMQRILDVLSIDLLGKDGAVGPAVTLKVQLAEVPVGSTADVGLDWLFGLSPTNNPVTETTRPNPKAGTRVDTLTSKGEWVTLKATQFDALRRSLESRAGVDLLTAPEVTTRSGRQAQVVVQDVRTLVTGVNAAVDPQTKAVGFDEVSVSATNTQPGISYQTESISTGPAVDILPNAENDGWQLITVARVTEFLGYDDPGKGNEPFVQAPGAKPLKATKPLARLRVREMVATAFAKPGETVALRGAMASRTNITRSGSWPVRRSQTNVVTQRLYAFITPQFTPARVAGAGVSAQARQPMIVRVMTREPGIQVGDQLVTESELPAVLKAAQAAKPNLVLLIRADADAPFVRLQSVLDVARQAGIPNVSLTAEPKTP